VVSSACCSGVVCVEPEYFVFERREHDCLRKKINAFRFLHIGHVDVKPTFRTVDVMYIMFASQLVNGFTFFGNSSRQDKQTPIFCHMCRHNLSIIQRKRICWNVLHPRKTLSVLHELDTFRSSCMYSASHSNTRITSAFPCLSA
jgi:hypothetical protein